MAWFLAIRISSADHIIDLSKMLRDNVGTNGSYVLGIYSVFGFFIRGSLELTSLFIFHLVDFSFVVSERISTADESTHPRRHVSDERISIATSMLG